MKKNKGRYKLNIKSYLFFNGNEVKNLIPFEYCLQYSNCHYRRNDAAIAWDVRRL